MRCYFPGRDWYFDAPREVISARDAAGVVSGFERAHDATRAGYFLAGFLSYELGYIFNGFPQHVPCETPLFVLGVYDRPIIAHQHAPTGCFTVSRPKPRISRERYAAAFRAIQHALYEGDVYQVNLTVPFDFSYVGEPFDLFRECFRESAAPYAAYIEHKGLNLLSFSPELFLRIIGNRIVTAPMKGTALPERRHELESEKNHAEHIMIVDLLRNDLGRVCRSVWVDRLLTEERYPTYHALVSTIGGELHAGATFFDVVTALFPCGSVTGAPKLAAMQSIAQLECAARGAYTGSIGFLAPDGSGLWNVAIRTVQAGGGSGRLDLGGGIVSDSTVEGEWDEILTKGRFFNHVALGPRLRNGSA